MRYSLLSAALAVGLLGGCTLTDTNPDWNPPAEYPGWAYDAPFYYRPTEDLTVVERVGPGVPVYYTDSEYFFLPHPDESQVDGSPRVAVWLSTDEGQCWRKEGYFGVEQTHFLCRGPEDGRYFVRFVGAGTGVTTVHPGMPHAIYVVDTHAPQIDVQVTPAAWEPNEPGCVARPFEVGESLTVRWTVSDPHVDPNSIRLGACFAEFPHNLVWQELPTELPAVGSETFEVPAQALADGMMRFRVLARDRSGNANIAMSDPLKVVRGDYQGPVPQTAPAEAFARTQGPPPEQARPGWPEAGEMLRGGQQAVLGWLPEMLAEYDAAELQFSANEGRTWKTVASGLTVGQPVRWMVPPVVSRKCRLRVVGIEYAEGPGKTVQRQDKLATSRRFVVDTVRPEVLMGPEEIPEAVPAAPPEELAE